MAPRRFAVSKKFTQLSIVVVMLFSMAGALAAVPEIFSPGVISGSADDAAPAFTPDGKTVYFFRSNSADYDIMVSDRLGDRWSKPGIASFSGKWRDLEPAMAPDGSYLIFASSRPLPGSNTPPNGSWGGQPHPNRGGNLWRVDRLGQGWSKPVHLPATVNRSNNVFSPSIAANGDLYFMQAAGEGLHFRLFMSALKNGVYQPAISLPFTAGRWGGVDPTVAPDESFLVFSSNRPPTPPQQSDLFIVFRKHGHWGTPVHLPAAINSYGGIIESRLGPDGHTLYFSSNYVVPPTYPKSALSALQGLKKMQSWNNGASNIWRVDISELLKSDGGSQKPKR
jgi:Tol biopolymer transport system component